MKGGCLRRSEFVSVSAACTQALAVTGGTPTLKSTLVDVMP
jgi:hypothetical protein